MKKRIGAIDCETLSLRTNAVIWEAALLVTTVNEWYEPLETDPPAIASWRLEVLSQLALGRAADPDTLAWSYKQHGPAFHELVYGTDGAQLLHPTEALNQIKRACRGLDEIWINGTSFDSARLHSLGEDLGVCDGKNGMWVYNSERDLRSFRHVLDLPDTVEELAQGKHRAMADTYWCWGMVQQLGQFLKHDVVAPELRKVKKQR